MKLAMQVTRAVHALLTPYLYNCLSGTDTHNELLTVMTTARTNCLVVWTKGMRSELRSVLDKHAALDPVTEEHLEVLGAMKYEEVADELVIEEVYIRLLCEVSLSTS
jgi:hypothetical protein